MSDAAQLTIIAMLNDASDHAGKRIFFHDGTFSLEGGGSLQVNDVLRYDERGQLEWAYDGLREWVRSVESARPASGHAEQKRTRVLGLLVGIVAWGSFVTASKRVPQYPEGIDIWGVVEILGIELAIAVIGVSVALWELRKGARKWAPMTGLVMSSVIAGLSGLFLVLYLLDFAGSRA